MGAPTLVASSFAANPNSPNISGGFSASLGPSNLMVVIVSRGSASSIALQGVSDNLGTNYQHVGSTLVAGTNLAADIFIGNPTKSGSSVTVTAIYSGNTAAGIIVMALTPQAVSDIVGSASTGNSNNPNASGGVANPPDLALFFNINDVSGGAATGGGSSGSQVQQFVLGSAYALSVWQKNGINSNPSFGVGLSTNCPWACLVITFYTGSTQPPPSPPPSPPPPPPGSGGSSTGSVGTGSLGGFSGSGKICATRLVKNAKFIQSKYNLLNAALGLNPSNPVLALAQGGFGGFNPGFIIPPTEPAAGYASLIPASILNQIEPVAGISPGFFHYDANGNITPDVQTGQNFGPLFNGTIYFVRIRYNVNGQLLSVPDSDLQIAMNMIAQAVSLIQSYCSLYGTCGLTVNPVPLNFTINLGSTNSFNDQSIGGLISNPNVFNAQVGQTAQGSSSSSGQTPSAAASGPSGWVDQICAQNGLSPNGTNICLVLLAPSSVLNTDAPVSQGYLGYHNISQGNCPYIFINVTGSPLTLSDAADAYELALTHEVAELTVDPFADLSNPEVCDTCGPNCQTVFRDYFDANNNYLLTSTLFPPTGANYAIFLNAICQPASSGQCPAPASACAYAPPSQFGQSVGPLGVPQSSGNTSPAINTASLTTLGLPTAALNAGQPGVPLPQVQNLQKKMVNTTVPGVQVIKMS